MKKYILMIAGLCFAFLGLSAYASGGNACSGTYIKILNATSKNIGNFKCEGKDYTCTFTKNTVSPDPDNSVVVGSMRSRDGSSDVYTLKGKVIFEVKDGGGEHKNTLITGKFRTKAKSLSFNSGCTTHADDGTPKIEYDDGSTKKYKVKPSDKNGKKSKPGYIKYKVEDATP